MNVNVPMSRRKNWISKKIVSSPTHTRHMPVIECIHASPSPLLSVTSFVEKPFHRKKEQKTNKTHRKWRKSIFFTAATSKTSTHRARKIILFHKSRSARVPQKFVVLFAKQQLDKAATKTTNWWYRIGEQTIIARRKLSMSCYLYEFFPLDCRVERDREKAEAKRIHSSIRHHHRESFRVSGGKIHARNKSYTRDMFVKNSPSPRSEENSFLFHFTLSFVIAGFNPSGSGKRQREREGKHSFSYSKRFPRAFLSILETL